MPDPQALPCDQQQRELLEALHVNQEIIRCSFCGKYVTGVYMMIASPRNYYPKSYICDECVDICLDLIEPPTATDLLLRSIRKENQ